MARLLRPVQVLMQGSIIPVSAQAIRQFPEAPKKLGAQLVRSLLIRGIAIIDPTAEGTCLTCRAVARVILPGTGCTLIQGTSRRRGVFSQDLRLDPREEERVVPL